MTPGSGPQSLGLAWESRAATFLQSHGIRIITQGYRCRLGELDIVGSDGDTLVIVEVKARRSGSHGLAVETVGPRKQRRIIRATRHYLMRNSTLFSQPIRFDVLAVDGIDTAEPKFTWVRNAFAAA
jgi:putative endonuclease